MWFVFMGGGGGGEGGRGGPVNHLLSMAAATSLQCLLLFYH